MGKGRTGISAAIGATLGVLLFATASMPGPAAAAEGIHAGYGQVQAENAREIGLTRGMHDGAWDGKPSLLRGLLGQLAHTGLGFTRAKGTGGAADRFVVRDVIMRGLDMRFDGGVQLAFGRHFALDLQALKRQGPYVEMKYTLAL